MGPESDQWILKLLSEGVYSENIRMGLLSRPPLNPLINFNHYKNGAIRLFTSWNNATESTHHYL